MLDGKRQKLNFDQKNYKLETTIKELSVHCAVAKQMKELTKVEN